MAMKARLFVDGEYYNLKSFEYGFITGSNANGFSSGKTRQAGLTCVVEAIRQEYFEEWAFEDNMKKYVEVHMQHTVQGQGKTRVLKCHDTFLLEFNTHFSATSEEPMTFDLFMKSGVIQGSWSTASHIEKWSSLPEEGEVTVIEQEEETDVVSCQYTDMEGNHIEDLDELPVDQNKVILEVKTENCIGKIIDIDLSEEDFGFKYNGKVLENDILTDLKIVSDFQKVELEVFDD